MAQAIICDRCGAIYKENANNRYTLFDTAKATDPHFQARYNGNLIGEPMDLCNNCLFQLTAWVSEGSME